MCVSFIVTTPVINRQGVIQPCRVGEDGKPQPVEHILQLTENIKLKDEDED